MKSTKITLVIVVVTLVLSTYSCRESDDRSDDSGTHEITVVLSSIINKKVSLPVIGSGLMSSDTEATLSFKIGGVIHKIFVDEGQKVKKGQLLARLDLTEINAKVTQAKNANDKAVRDLTRVQNLYEDDAATLTQVQDLTTLVNVTAQDLQIATFNKRYAEIRAVSNGIIVGKMMNEGELVSSGTPILFMNDDTNDQWKLEIGVSDKDWARLSVGDKATIAVDAYSNKEFSGKVWRLSQGVDPTNGSYKVEIKVDPNNHKFATGMFAKAYIKTSSTNTYPMIPVESLVDVNGKHGYVFVMDGQTKVKRMPIEIAFIDKEMVAVSKGLTSSDEVVTAGSGFLNESVTVKVQSK